jgi:hypothetical protein
MLTGDNETRAAGQLQILRIIVGALCMGVVVFQGVVLTQRPLEMKALAIPMDLVPLLTAAVMIVMSFVLPVILRNATANQGTPDAGTSSLEKALVGVQTETIVGAALLEGAAFMNLAFAFTGGNLLHLLAANVPLLFLFARMPFSKDAFLHRVEQRLQD